MPRPGQRSCIGQESIGAVVKRPATKANVAEYGLSDTCVRVQSQERLIFEFIAPMFAQLRLKDGANVDFTLTIKPTPSGYTILGNNAPLAQGL